MPTLNEYQEVRALSEQELNVRAAELSGLHPWYRCPNHSEVDGPRCPWCFAEVTHENCPPACTDLNACREMEATLTDDEYERYSCDLWSIVNPEDIRQPSHPVRCERAFLSATARQRTEAYVLTKKAQSPMGD